MSVALAVSGNGQVVSGKRPAKRRAAKGKAMVAAKPRLAAVITVGMGVGIPALTLSMSTVAGQLCQKGHYGLGVCAGLVGGAVLVVSLSHLAWAVGNITRSSKWASWLLAVAVDVGLVACESVLTAAPGVCDTLATGVLWAVTGVSAVLNCWAFLRHSK